jgi:ABC-type bacteriocin/lantibiotic exporter with double-glycine peptidase domain
MNKKLFQEFKCRDVGATGRPFLFLLLSLVFFSCASFPDTRLTGNSYLIENVPFYPQEAFQCAPSSMAGVLNYYDMAVSPETIADEIYSKGARGSLGIDLVIFAEKQNVKVRHYEGSIRDIKNNIDSRQPLIVMVDYGFWVFQRNHFMVVIGYNEQGVIVNSGREQRKFLAFEKFLASWERTDFWTLLATPG